MTVKVSDLRRAALGGAACWRPLLARVRRRQQVQTQFMPTRVIAFGDETSVIVDSGDRTPASTRVNATVSDTEPTIDCASNPLWIQAVGEALRPRLSAVQPGTPRCSRRSAGSAPPSARASRTSAAQIDAAGRQERARRRRPGDGAGRRERRARAVRAVPGARARTQLIANARGRRQADRRAGQPARRPRREGASSRPSRTWACTPFGRRGAAHLDTDRSRAAVAPERARSTRPLLATDRNDGQQDRPDPARRVSSSRWSNCPGPAGSRT